MVQILASELQMSTSARLTCPQGKLTWTMAPNRKLKDAIKHFMK